MHTIAIFLCLRAYYFDHSVGFCIQMEWKPYPRDSVRQLITVNQSGLNDINNSKRVHLTEEGVRERMFPQLIGDIFDSTAFRRRNETRDGMNTEKQPQSHQFSFFSFVCSLIYFVNYKRWVFITLNIEQRTKREREKNVNLVNRYRLCELCMCHVRCPCVFVSSCLVSYACLSMFNVIFRESRTMWWLRLLI